MADGPPRSSGDALPDHTSPGVFIHCSYINVRKYYTPHFQSVGASSLVRSPCQDEVVAFGDEPWPRVNGWNRLSAKLMEFSGRASTGHLNPGSAER